VHVNPLVPAALYDLTNTYPSGSVTFLDGATVLGTGSLNTNGVATYDAGTGLTVGSHTITVRYPGDTFYLGNTNTYTQVVNSGTLTPPTILGAVISGGNFQITFSGPSSQTYAVLSTTNLATGPWITNSTGTFGGGSVTYTNTTPTGNKFYRVKSP